MYMLREREVSEFSPRTRTAMPPRAQTGIEKANELHPEVFMSGKAACREAGTCSAIASASTGTVSVKPNQNRRVMSTSSGFGPSSPVATTGSSAMPHFGQAPGPTWRTSGCMGHV